jgi:DnaJ-class molecular chaperone
MSEGPPEYDAARTKCRPCGGTGKVISSLGGEQHQVTCPWCRGSGQFIAGRDAQHPDRDAPPSTA